MMNLCSDVLNILSGRTLATAESCTGGGIGYALTAIPGSSSVYIGGIISYSNDVKRDMLNVDAKILEQYGAVSAPVAEAMARGVRNKLGADVAVSVTGLAGPDGDAYGNPVGTVYIGYCDRRQCVSQGFVFTGGREDIRESAICQALKIILKYSE